MKVDRYSIWNESLQSWTGDYLRVDDRELGHVKGVADLEYERAKKENPKHPEMRPMFYTGSPYGAEILALIEGRENVH